MLHMPIGGVHIMKDFYMDIIQKNDEVKVWLC